jgi:hypothetical protein
LLNTERSAQVFEQQRAADVAVAVAGARVEAETGMLIAMLMAFGKWTRAIQPVSAWLATERSKCIGDTCDQIGIGDEFLTVR